MKIDEMELLVRVAETGSMTTAARQMHVTPAAVSAAVKRIEGVLGVRVFDRTTRAVRATDEGELLVEACREVLSRWNRALDDVGGAAAELRGDVHISCPADTAYQVVAPVVRDIMERHRGLQVIVHSSDTVQHLHREAIDVAIRYGPLQDSALTARRLADWPGILVASPAYIERAGAPATVHGLRDHACITLQLSSAPFLRWTLQRSGQDESVVLNNPLCGDGHLSRLWALDGAGIAMKSLFDVIDDLETGRLVRVLPEHVIGGMPIHVVFPTRRHLPARVREVDERLAAAFASRSARCEAWLAASGGAR